MNITKNQIDDLNAVLTIQIIEEDYAPRVDEQLKDYRKKVDMKGFRKGMVPMGVVRKMYGKSVLVDEVNKLISESVGKYITDEKLNLLGEPLPNAEQTTLDFDVQKEFTFSFDIAIAPEFELTLNKKTKVPYHKITISDEMIEEQMQSHAQRNGKNAEVEVATENSLLKGVLTQTTEAGDVVEGGHTVADASIGVHSLKEEESKKIFVGANVKQIINLDVKKTFTNETDLAALLQLEKEALDTVGDFFQYEVTSISDFQTSEINQELFDTVYGAGTVDSEEAFKLKISEEISGYMTRDMDYKFFIDAKEKLTKKLKLEFPEPFLRRWLKATDKEGKLTDEVLEVEFPMFKDDLAWQLIRDFLIKENDLKVTQEEIKETAIENVNNQFLQYGMPLGSMPPEQIEKFAQDMYLSKEEELRKLYDQKYQDKVIAYLKETVKLDEKEVTLDEFKAFFEKKEA